MGVPAKRSSAQDSSYCVSDQQNLGSSPGRDTVVSLSKKLKIMIASSFGWDVKPLVPFVA